MTPSPLMLYVHIPYCAHKCHYCDFNSHASAPDWQSYQHALITELKSWRDTAAYMNRELSSIFIGGGTPSLAPPSLIERVIQTSEQLFGFKQGVEITIEANPGSADADNFAAYRDAGVNRLSMGVQSLNNRELHWLERIHDRDEAITALESARAAGFDNINLDLMYGLPDQTEKQWLQTLCTAIELGTEHLSCYQLTVEPHTKLAATHAQSPLPLPDDELAISMLNKTRSRVNRAGFEAYEISNFARPGKQCRHNDGYWKYYDYIGIGAGAAGKWDERGSTRQGGITRYSNIRTPSLYIKAVQQRATAINSQEQLSLQQSAAEAAWLGLRRKHGVQRARFMGRFGFDVADYFRDSLRPWQQQLMLEINDTHLLLTEQGVPMADAIAASLL